MSPAAGGWPFPGLVWGPYPQVRMPAAATGRRAKWSRRSLAALARQLHAQRAVDVPAVLQSLRMAPDARRDEAWLQQALHVAGTALTDTLGVRPYWQQLMAARALLDQRLVEMATGEGKTIAIALAAATAALAGTPVHVVTANDYLAQRDAEGLQPFFAGLGLRAGFVSQPKDMAARRAAYACDITYCTAKELAFDYLRDGLLQPSDLSPLERSLRDGNGPFAPRPVLRGLCMAILDEADTILIDEARVPLVLSQPAAALAEEEFLRQALQLARGMQAGRDYQAVATTLGMRLTPAGHALLAQWPAERHPLLGHPQHRAAAVESALTALHRLERDRDYVLRDGQVVLVDDTTGRIAPGRAWSRGLHQLVELKEGMALTQRNATVMQITFQRFFVRYLRLAGISGTLRGSGRELRAVYGLGMVRVPPRMPRRVRRGPTRLFADSARLWQAVAERAIALRAAGRPVLIGTESVRQSEALVAVLRERGLQPRVLNARQDDEESRIISEAGQPAQLTVATSMAGRGAHIVIPPQVQERGGLHVILCQLNASPRIDRQFIGRAGRQGQPGSCEVMVAQDFVLLQRWIPDSWHRLLRFLGCPPLLSWSCLRCAQMFEAHTRSQQRVTLARIAESEERELNFSRWGMG